MTDEELPSLEMPIFKPVMPEGGALEALTPESGTGAARPGGTATTSSSRPGGPVTLSSRPSEASGEISPNATTSDPEQRFLDSGLRPALEMTGEGVGLWPPLEMTEKSVAPQPASATTGEPSVPQPSSEATSAESAEYAPATQEFASTRVNASSGHPIAAILGKGQPAPPQIPLAPMKRMQARFNPLADGMLYLVVFLGGFVGTGMRYGLNLLLPNPAAPSGFFHAFHPATFIANMCACFIFAALSAYMSQASWIRKRTRELTSRGVGMGMCGGFSTLSAMAIEDLTSIHNTQIGGFLFYTLVSFACGLLVAWIGTKMALSIAAKHAVKALHEQISRGDGSHIVRSSAPSGDYGQPQNGERSVASASASSIVPQTDQSSAAAGNPGESTFVAQPSGESSADVVGGNQAVDPSSATTFVPSFEPDPVTDEIQMVADPMRGEAHPKC